MEFPSESELEISPIFIYDTTSEIKSEKYSIIICYSALEMSETPVVPKPATQKKEEQITANEERNNNQTMHAIDLCA